MNLHSKIILHTGNKMPVLGLGTWKLNNDTARFVENALRLGYPMVDTSGDYGTQPGVGQAIKNSGLSREKFYLVTKVEEDEDAYESTKNNLKELGLDYADLMLIHRPPKTNSGYDLWKGLIRAKQEGLTKDIGVSNYSTDLIQELIDESGEVPVVNQIEWSPFGHSQDMFNFCQSNEIVIQAYSPLTRTEKFDNKTLTEIAKKYQKTPAQILIRWNLQLGTVPLPKANQARHQEENLDVFDFDISPDDIETLNSLNTHYSALGSLPYV